MARFRGYIVVFAVKKKIINGQVKNSSNESKASPFFHENDRATYDWIFG